MGGRFASRNKINGPSPSSAALRPRTYKARGAAPARASGKSLAIKAARGGRQLQGEETMTTTHDFEPAHHRSATARVIDNLELHGYQPSGNEPDPRPLPEPDRVAGAISDLFDILAGALPRHEPRARPRRSVLASDRPLPQKGRPRAASARRQRGPAKEKPGGTGRL